MKVIIAGSRSVTDMRLVEKAIRLFSEHEGQITEVICGGAPGVDTIGKEWAESQNIPVKRFRPKWRDWSGLPEHKIRIKQSPNGRSYNALAGFNRNEEMAGYADALIAIWDGKSSGTAHMIDTMYRLNKPVHVVGIECDYRRGSAESEVFKS